MVEFIGKLAAVFADSRVVRTIHNGLINLIPFVLVGAVCIALFNLPIFAYQSLLDTLFMGRAREFSQLITFASLDIIALATLLSVAYTYALEEPSVKNGDIHPFIPTFVALACYIILFVWDGGTTLTFLTPGRAGVFSSLVVSLFVTWLFFFLVRVWAWIRPPRLSALDTNLQMRSAFRAVFPVTVIIIVLALARLVVPMVLPADVPGTLFSNFAKTWLVNDSLGSVLLTVLFVQMAWFFGIHGAGTVFTEFPSVASLADPTQVMFATQDFYFNFVSFGGAGMTLGLLIALFVAGSKYRGRRLAKASVFPSLFNINEILLYGIPLILNPFFLIPFVLAPLLAVALCYLAFSLGLVPPIVHSVEWTCPIFLSGYLSTGSLAGSLLQLMCLACSTAIYLPFIIANRRYERHRLLRRVRKMQSAALEAADNEGVTVLSRNDVIGETAREISSRLHGYFETDTLPFHLVYQPKTDENGRVMGAEALLRWNHPDFGVISPVVLVELCDESGLATALGRWIMRKAISEYVHWERSGLFGLRLSINLHARHLREDAGLPAFLNELFSAHHVKGEEIELEITEHLALHANQANKRTIAEVRALGVELSIDDMGIGYSSLTYISDFDARGVKIDASLVSAIATDIQQKEIVASIVQLATQLDLTVVVEGVETKEQVDTLVALGVRYFQGYFFSKPLAPQDFITFTHNNGIAPVEELTEN